VLPCHAGDLEAAVATLGTVNALNRAALDALVAEAIVDCYNDSECIAGFLHHARRASRRAVPDRGAGRRGHVTGADLTDDERGALHSRTVAAADPDPRPAAADTTTRGHGVDRGMPALVEVSHQDE
jgi:hypothetical protein